MQLSQESYRTRWILLVSLWALSALLFFGQARLVNTYLTTVGQLGLRGLPATSTPFQQAFPAFAADAQMWVRHATALTEGNSLRLRFTTIDNAPDGREVHWNSAWAWVIAGAGWVQHLFTGQPLPRAIERATLWINPTVLLLLIIVVSAWTTRRAGAIAGMVMAITMTCHDRVFEGFFPSYVDHHGLLTVAVLGLTLGAVLMGAGWWKPNPDGGPAILPNSPEQARRGATFSAISGACGLWVSAASTIPPIAIIGIAGVLAIVIHGRASRDQGATFDPDTWRRWGRVGAGASLFFYLLEYFPSHMGLRLEPNHPFHALAWLGGGELIAQFGTRWFAPREERWQNATRLIAPLIAVMITPVTILLGGSKVFVPIDPFLARLHNDYIQEFLPMWKTLRGFDFQAIVQSVVMASIPLVAAILTLTYFRRTNSIVLWFATIVAVFLNVMAWWQSRWLLNVSGIQICLVLVLLAIWTPSLRPAWRWGVAVGVAVLLFVPNTIIRFVGAQGDIMARRVSPKDALAPLNRDIAAALRASQPEGEITMLSSPNGSVGIGYYGRFKTLGTLYWENNDGLKAAAAILGAQTEREAATLVRAHRITHVAIVSDENFIAQYYQLQHPGASLEEIKKSFGLQLLVDKKIPQWLQMIPYKVPDDLGSLKVTVMLFKVNFKQNLAEAVYHVALSQIAEGAYEEADRMLDILLKQAPHNYQPWIRRAELLLGRHNWVDAAQHYLKGISLAPKADRPALYITAGKEFYTRGQHGLAIDIYRAALTDEFVPEIASYLAWILSTSQHDRLRNGPEALRLIETALKADPNSPSFLNVFAAALAENGRFNDAVTIADRSLANARLRGQAAAIGQFEQRLAVLRSGKPLRQ